MKDKASKEADGRKASGYFLQDAAMLLFLAVLFAGIAAMVLVPEELRMEFLGMLMVTFLGVLFAAYRYPILSAVCAGMQITVFTAYKLFFYFAYGNEILPMEYLWLFYPLLAVGSMSLFISRSRKMEETNLLLREQIDHLMLVDPLTGLYNLKCLYLDMELHAALAARKKTDITLMIIAFRYEEELRRILGTKNFDQLKKQAAYLVQDCLRIEDKLYVIDEKGTMATILTCDAQGA